MPEEKKAEVDTEYPKSLHVGGDRAAPERIVRSEDEERAARADGFKMIDKERDAEAAARLAEPEEAEAEKKPAKKAK